MNINCSVNLANNVKYIPSDLENLNNEIFKNKIQKLIKNCILVVILNNVNTLF